MRKTLLLCGLLLMPACGCSSMNNTEAGAAGGAAIGGIFGGLIGAATGRPLAGAAIGAGLGGTLGAVDGSAQDRREQRYNNQVAAAVNAQQARQMTLNEIVQMSQQNVPEHLIINQINTTGSVFQLRGEDITYLQQQNVSSRVIAEMQSHSARPVIVQQRPVVVVDPYGPPPPGVIISGGYRRW